MKVKQFSIKPEDFKKRYDELLNERIGPEGLWGDVEMTIDETSGLINESNDLEATNILNDTLKHLKKMQSLID